MQFILNKRLVHLDLANSCAYHTEDAGLFPPVTKIFLANPNPAAQHRCVSSLSALTTLASAEVERALRSLPEPVQTLARDVTVIYQPTPPDDVLAEGFEPDLLGLFSGTAYGDALSESQPMPPTISLYLANLWDFAEHDREYFREEVRITYLHELGHYLGWDEDDLAARGLD